MKLTATHKRALVLLNRGQQDPFFRLSFATMQKLEAAGYINPDEPNLVTMQGLRAATKP